MHPVTGSARQLPLLRPRDFESAPLTGLTRAHYQDAADILLAGVARHSKPPYSYVSLQGRPGSFGLASDALEGFARTFLLLGFRVHSSAGANEHIDRYREGLVAGVTPGTPNAWPEISSRHQTMVEAAAIAIALSCSKKQIWNNLSNRERSLVTAWLLGINNKDSWPNNQILFPGVVNAFLASVDAPHETIEIEHALQRIEPMYAGNGWYTDGGHSNFDYYSAWTFHIYPGLIASMIEDNDRVALYRSRLNEFLNTYKSFFAPNGAPVYFGRSLICRTATIAPFFMAGVLGATGMNWGELRTHVNRTFDFFARSEILAAGDDTVVAGWIRPSLLTTQAYSGPSSAYWLSKGFIGLLLPEAHPIWTQREIQTDPPPSVTHAPCIAVSRSSNKSIALLHPYAAVRDYYGDDPHYKKLIYTSSTAPNCSQESSDATVLVRSRRGPRDSVRVGGKLLLDTVVLDEFVTYPAVRRTRLRKFARAVLPWMQRIQVVKIINDDWTSWLIKVRSREARVTVLAGSIAIPHATPDELSCEITPHDGTIRSHSLTHQFSALLGWDSLELCQETGTNPMGAMSSYLLASASQKQASCIYAVSWAIGQQDASLKPPEIRLAGDAVLFTSSEDNEMTINFGNRNVTVSESAGTKR